MAIILGQPTKVRIFVSEEPVTFVFPPRMDADFQRGIEKLLSGRFITKGIRTKNQSMEARKRFFNAYCQDVENVELQKGEPLNATVDGWKGFIPGDWKASAAMYFEETESEELEDVDRD